MVTVAITYNQINEHYEADELWRTSYLMLYICRKLQLWPSRVSFHNSDGTALDRNQLLKNIATRSPDLSEEDSIINITVRDVITSHVEKYQNEHQKEMKLPVCVDVNIMPQGRRLKKWLRPDDSLASIVGTLMLEGRLSQIIDVRCQNKSLLRQCLPQDGEMNDYEILINNPVGDLQLMGDCGLRDGDHIEIVYPQLEIDEDRDESDDMLEHERTSPRTKDEVNLVIESTDDKKIFEKKVRSNDSYLSILGDLLIDGFLNYRLVISRNDETLLDTKDKPPVAKRQDKRDRSPLRDNSLRVIKGESMVKYFNLKDDDILSVRWETLHIPKKKQDKEKNKAGYIKVDLIIHRSKLSKSRISRIHVRSCDTVSTLARYLRRSPQEDNVVSIRYKGENIVRRDVTLFEDKRLLMKDIGLVNECKLRIFMKSPVQRHVCIQCELPDKSETQIFYVEHNGNPRGNIVIQLLTEKFKVKYKDLLVWQEMCYPQDKTRERIYYYEVESDTLSSTSEWRMMDIFAQAQRKRSNESKHSDRWMKLNLNEKCWKRVVQLDGDTEIRFPSGTVPIVHALINVKYRRAASDGVHLVPINPNSELSRGLNCSLCLGYQQAIMVQDRVKNRHPTYFYVRTRKGYIDPKIGKHISKSDLKDEKTMAIPVGDRVSYYVIIPLFDKAIAPKHIIPEDDNVSIWLREGNMTVMMKGTFTDSSGLHAKHNSWLYPFPFSFGTEKYYSDFLRTQLVHGHLKV